MIPGTNVDKTASLLASVLAACLSVACSQHRPAAPLIPAPDSETLTRELASSVRVGSSLGDLLLRTHSGTQPEVGAAVRYELWAMCGSSRILFLPDPARRKRVSATIGFVSGSTVRSETVSGPPGRLTQLLLRAQHHCTSALVVVDDRWMVSFMIEGDNTVSWIGPVQKAEPPNGESDPST